MGFENELKEVQWRLRRLQAARLTFGLTAKDEAEYDELCRRERELLRPMVNLTEPGEHVAIDLEDDAHRRVR